MSHVDAALPPGVLYEDDALIAVDKPDGMVVIPARDEPPAGALRQRLEQHYGARLWVVHRIDRDTTGVVIFAKNEAAHRSLSRVFEQRMVRKLYTAYTRGVPQPPQGVCATPLHAARKGKMRPARAGEPDSLASTTSYTVKGSWSTELGHVAWIDAAPHTGRQHQIRVHLRSLGAPLLVDPLYGGASERVAGALGHRSPALTRLTLHARRVEFAHPSDGRALVIESPLPADLAALRDWLASRDQS